MPIVTSQSHLIATLKKSLVKILHFLWFSSLYSFEVRRPTLPPRGKARPSPSAPADRDFLPGHTAPPSSVPVLQLMTSQRFVQSALPLESTALHESLRPIKLIIPPLCRQTCVQPTPLGTAVPSRMLKHNLSATAFAILTTERLNVRTGVTPWRDPIILSPTDRKHPHSAVWKNLL